MRKISTLIAILTLSWVGLAQADDIEDGARLYTEKLCLTCHGEQGEKPIMPVYPKLGGQNADYALEQMKDIKSGARSNGQSAAMKAIVAAVTDDELAKIAKYLEAQTPAAVAADTATADGAAADGAATDGATATQ